ncbi:MATE family efflux transporter [Alicyclobacillus kakegawensis]|uniref:MATE family efflux transporter n=1 Tax=Alicyclobacillus kakegawensis TaxID=392012 RepID=UPI000AA8B2DE|nr:MATE family efflux transporter [Alicyclobacillus kakegawensis]
MAVVHLWKNILKLALPSIATFSSMTLTGMITLILVGRLGPSAIAIVGVSNVLMYNTWALFAGLNESVNYLVSQNYGEQTMREGNERTQIALCISACLSVGVFLASFFTPYAVLVAMGVSHPLAALGAPYLQARFIAFSFTLLTNVFYAYMRGVGDTKTPMYISLATNVLLVVLTYGLTYGHFGLPDLGLVGAGWSMVVTEFLGFAASVAVYYGRYHAQFHTRTWLAMARSQVRLILVETVKLSVMELSMSLGMLVFTACITRLGTDAIAANEIALNILSLGFMPANGFGMAATVAVGQEIGRGQPQAAKTVGLHTLLLGLMFMALFSICLWLFALPATHIYTSDARVALLAVSLIHIASFIQLFDGGGIVLSGGLRGVGDTTFLFRMSLILNWLLFIPMTIVVTRVLDWGQAGAWLALCTLLVGIAVANLWRYLSIRWELMVTKSQGVRERDTHQPTASNTSV